LQFIVVGGVIGAGFFSGSSLILGVAGPGGALLAFTLVGAIAIAVMEGICEMILLWPIPNAMVEFVKAFVDEELSIVIGFGYWYVLIIYAVGVAD
jgi:yeast amino acid transporter